MDKNEFFAALQELGKEKGLEITCLVEKVKTAMAIVARREFDGVENIFIEIDEKTDKFEVEIGKTVVEKVNDPTNEILFEQARRICPTSLPGEMVRIQLDPDKVGRIAAQGAKQVIRQGIREAERQKAYLELKEKEGQLVTAIVHRVEDNIRNFIVVKIDDYEAILPKSEQLQNQVFKEGDLIKIYVSEVLYTEKGPKVMLSRTGPEFVKKLFELEVPEVESGTVEIMAVAREAGFRTKIAVASNNSNVDPVGTCIGQKGMRINRVLRELGNEKIDIIAYHEDPASFIKAAVSPAEVKSVKIIEVEDKSCEVIVEDDQVSLAIGHRGQNARLVAKLTGYKVDIKSASSVKENSSLQADENQKALPEEDFDLNLEASEKENQKMVE